MGSGQTKLSYRSAFVELANKTQPIDANNDEFWDQFWDDYPAKIRDIFVLVPAVEIRALREESPSNLATLCYKAVERLSQIAEASFPTQKDQLTALNCMRLLTRIMPYIFEETEWRSFFWSALPQDPDTGADGTGGSPLAQTLVSSLCDLLFCPDFTVNSISKSGPEGPEDMHTIDSCEYIWEAGVGFAQSQQANVQHDSNRTEILRLLLVCFSETMYLDQAEARSTYNKWIAFFTGPKNRHVLPLFASLLNIACAYNPASSTLPYNHLVFTDSREPLVEVALQTLCVALETDIRSLDLATLRGGSRSNTNRTISEDSEGTVDENINLFVNYMSRIHRDEDFAFILNGIARLLNNPLTQTYLPGSAKKVQMHQELLILFWRMCDINRKFMFYVLKSSRVLEILVPILYHLNEARAEKSQLGMMHIGVFIILLLSGERNFGVRLNKPYTNRVPMDITVFTGNHADLLIIVFHKIITTGHSGLQPLFDCLITSIDNVSPYVKSLSMVSATKLIHLAEAFSQPWFLFSAPNNFQLILFLLEIFNNIIQYQFDGNSCLIYTIIRKRQIFYHLANLPKSESEIRDALSKHGGGKRFEHVEETTSLQSARLTENSTPTKSTTPRSQGDTQSTDNVEPSMANSTVLQSESPLPMIDMTNGETGHQETKASEGSTSMDLANGDVEADAQELSTILPEVGAFQASLLGTPALASMIDQQSIGQSVLPATVLGGGLTTSTESCGFDELHSHEAPTSPLTVGPTLNEVQEAGAERLTLQTDGIPTNHSSTQLNISFGPPANDAEMKASLSENSTAPSSSLHPRVQLSPQSTNNGPWCPTSKWVADWQSKLPLQTIMRLLQVLVPQVEKICIEKGLTDESEVLKFLQNGTLVGLLPVPHPILIRKYQSNLGTAIWFRTYVWGVIYLRNIDPPIWYDTNVRLFEVQRI